MCVFCSTIFYNFFIYSCVAPIRIHRGARAGLAAWRAAARASAESRGGRCAVRWRWNPNLAPGQVACHKLARDKHVTPGQRLSHRSCRRTCSRKGGRPARAAAAARAGGGARRRRRCRRRRAGARGRALGGAAVERQAWAGEGGGRAVRAVYICGRHVAAEKWGRTCAAAHVRRGCITAARGQTEGRAGGRRRGQGGRAGGSSGSWRQLRRQVRG